MQDYETRSGREREKVSEFSVIHSIMKLQNIWENNAKKDSNTINREEESTLDEMEIIGKVITHRSSLK